MNCWDFSINVHTRRFKTNKQIIFQMNRSRTIESIIKWIVQRNVCLFSKIYEGSVCCLKIIELYVPSESLRPISDMGKMIAKRKLAFYKLIVISEDWELTNHFCNTSFANDQIIFNNANCSKKMFVRSMKSIVWILRLVYCLRMIEQLNCIFQVNHPWPIQVFGKWI